MYIYVYFSITKKKKNEKQYLWKFVYIFSSVMFFQNFVFFSYVNWLLISQNTIFTSLLKTETKRRT